MADNVSFPLMQRIVLNCLGQPIIGSPACKSSYSNNSAPRCSAWYQQTGSFFSLHRSLNHRGAFPISPSSPIDANRLQQLYTRWEDLGRPARATDRLHLDLPYFNAIRPAIDPELDDAA